MSRLRDGSLEDSGAQAYTRVMAQAGDQPTSFQRFEDALKRVLSVPKKDVDKAVTREKKAREARRTEQPK